MAARKPAPTPSSASDEQLLVAAAQDDPAKFEALYELHFERVYAFIVHRVRDRATAEDLTSDVFHKALANLRNFEWRGLPFSAWLFRIAANAVADQWKRAARELPAATDLSDPAADAARSKRPSSDEPHGPDLDAIENTARVFRLVGQLPEAQRQVVHKRFLEQRSIREIAQQLGKTEGAIKQLQFRALQNLRAQMEGSHA
jgi:RNA polymerase sigma-70 factor (ECF subfamily)